MTWPNLSTEFFEVTRGTDAGTRVEAFQEFDDHRGYQDGRSDEYYPRCGEQSPIHNWSCNWRIFHPGHHDAWLEGEALHVAHWFNEDAEFVISEEPELEFGHASNRVPRSSV